jgi:hypothetical protein
MEIHMTGFEIAGAAFLIGFFFGVGRDMSSHGYRLFLDWRQRRYAEQWRLKNPAVQGLGSADLNQFANQAQRNRGPTHRRAGDDGLCAMRRQRQLPVLQRVR